MDYQMKYYAYGRRTVAGWPSESFGKHRRDHTDLSLGADWASVINPNDDDSYFDRWT